MSDLQGPVFKAYVFGTSFWYALRGACRLVDPIRVSEWFRPPTQPVLQPSDLELYNIWTDGWQLITLAILLTTLSGAVPLPGSSTSSSADITAKKPYAKAAVLATIFHHVTTAYGAYQHWVKPTHYTAAMAIGVWANVFLTVAGLVALVYGLGEGDRVVEKVSKKRA